MTAFLCFVVAHLEWPDMAFLPDNKVELDADGAGKLFRLVDVLEDLDDVQNIFANFDVPDDVMAELD